MKKLLLLCIAVSAMSCQNSYDLSLYEANQKIAKELVSTYESPVNYELFKSLIHEDVEHQSPMYGVGKIGYTELLAQGEFYMTGFENVTFTEATWLPGVDETTLLPDGSVRVYGIWSGNNIASGKVFAVDAYHYFNVQDGKIIASGDFFDATGMVMAIQPDPVVEEVVNK